MELEELKPGVIRDSRLFRANNAAKESANAEYKAVRPAVMQRGKYTCVFCAWVSRKNNECHHKDGNHANNTEENLVVADNLCHGYHHLGQRASQEMHLPGALGDKTVLAAIPEISASDLNLLQRALGVALLQEDARESAKELLDILAGRAEAVEAALGTFKPGDVAAAMARMTNEEYEHRDPVCYPLRVLFRHDVLESEGRKFQEDFPGLPFETWNAVLKNAD